MTIADPTITRSSFQEPNCYDCFSQSLADTDLCRPSLTPLPRCSTVKSLIVSSPELFSL